MYIYLYSIYYIHIIFNNTFTFYFYPMTLESWVTFEYFTQQRRHLFRYFVIINRSPRSMDVHL